MRQLPIKNKLFTQNRKRVIDLMEKESLTDARTTDASIVGEVLQGPAWS